MTHRDDPTQLDAIRDLLEDYRKQLDAARAERDALRARLVLTDEEKAVVKFASKVSTRRAGNDEAIVDLLNIVDRLTAPHDAQRGGDGART